MQHSMLKNQGAALVTSLVLLMALTMLSLSAIQSTSVQLQISGNDEATIEADQYAQSVIDAVIETSTNFVVGTSNGYTVCAANESGCNATTIALTDPMFTNVGVTSTTGVQAKVVLIKTSTAPRLGNTASSAAAFSGAYFSIHGRYNETANNRGQSNVVQGFVMIYPKN